MTTAATSVSTAYRFTPSGTSTGTGSNHVNVTTSDGQVMQIRETASSTSNSNNNNKDIAMVSPTHTSSTNRSTSRQQQQQQQQQPSSSGTPARRGKKQYAVSTRWERQVAERGGNSSHPFCDINTCFCFCASRRIGNMFSLCERADGSPIVIAGPCWPFCCFVTVPLILAISGAVAYFVIISQDSPLPIWLAFIYFPVLGFVLAALFCVSCQDPGLMERVTDEEAGEGGWFWNEQVGSFRPPGALYCRECGVLVQDYDHLCPWTGTGIGRKNMLAFKVFVIGINVLCYFSVILVIVALLYGLRAS